LSQESPANPLEALQQRKGYIRANRERQAGRLAVRAALHGSVQLLCV